ncbi:MAG: tRNA guanosine(34) transglycosylase Tgt [Candidatus Krumholzibacteria bacterium]|nr:tRNA guanosine(34) transglycosylase Tgt [Candidatus Krumholzibacteria bacterium]
MPFGFRLECTSGGARAGVIHTDHGSITTPVFMPVGTQGTVKATTSEKLKDPIGAQIILGNAYHLFLRPGVALVERAGGLHRFIEWDRPILTDSGGYQVYSLADMRRIDDDGISFRSHIDGSLHLFTPEVVIEAQAKIGADIIMSFDYCAPFPCERAEAERAVELTTDWAKRGLSPFGSRFTNRDNEYEQVVFGIVQGSCYPDLRRRSMEALLGLDFPGYAVGGLSVGEAKDQMWEITELVAGGLPQNRPRYLMGVGTPMDLVDGVACGIDMFDCVMPTRNARNGTVFTRKGKMVLKNTAFTDDFLPIDEECGCDTCRDHSRAYIRHLFAAGEILGPVLATHHSLYFYCDLMRRMRAAIEADRFEAWRAEFTEQYNSGEHRVAREQ